VSITAYFQGRGGINILCQNDKPLPDFQARVGKVAVFPDGEQTGGQQVRSIGGLRAGSGKMALPPTAMAEMAQGAISTGQRPRL